MIFIYFVYLFIYTSILGLFNYAFNTSAYKVEGLVNEEWELT